MQVFHGDIVTCDQKGSVFKYLVEESGKIVYIGDQLPRAYAHSSDAIELDSKALLPAFGDGHIHFSNWALFNATFDVRFAADFEEIKAEIKSYAARDSNIKVLFGFGHSAHVHAEQRLITRSELDEAVKERPVFLVCYEGHSAVANSAAIGLLPPGIRALRGFDLETGQLFHEAFIAATDYISGKIPVTKLLKYILHGMDTLASFGVSLVHTVEGVGFPRDLDVDMVRFLARGAQGNFRVYFQTMDIKKVLKRGLPRVGGCFACALDGCLGSKDAAMLEPYCDDPQNRGILFYSDEEVTAFVKEANRAGLQVQLHCIGDAAAVQAVNAIEAALQDFPRENHRHTLIHGCIIPEGLLDKIAALGIGITIQPGFLVSSLEPPEYLESIIGKRAKDDYWPLRKMLEKGIMLSGGSDGPVTIPNPIEGIFGACNHQVSEQSMTIAEALRMYTYNIAYTSFDEKNRGSLEEGKIADMIILDRNPLLMSAPDLMQLKVERIFMAGLEYIPGKKLPRALIDSLKNRSRQV